MKSYLETIKQMDNDELLRINIFKELASNIYDLHGHSWSREDCFEVFYYLLSERKFGLEETKIPDDFYLEHKSHKSSTPSTARIDPVAAVSGGDPYESQITSAPSNKSNKKTIIVSKYFFGRIDIRTKYSENRKIQQINRLRQEGFRIILCTKKEESFQELTRDINHDDCKYLSEFNDDDYDSLLRYKSLPKKNIVLLDRYIQLDTLFLSGFNVAFLHYLMDPCDSPPPEYPIPITDILVKNGLYDSVLNQGQEERIFRAIRTKDHELIGKLLELYEEELVKDYKNLSKMFRIAIFSNNLKFYRYICNKYKDHENFTKIISQAAKEIANSKNESYVDIFIDLLKISKSKDPVKFDDELDELMLGIARNGHINTAKKVASLFKIDPSKAQDLLMLAIENNHIDMVDFLLKNGAKFIGNGNEELNVASKKGFVDMVDFLLKKGVKFKGNGNEELNIASKKGFVDMVRFLLKKGVSLESNRPLIEAAKNGHLEIVKVLFQAGMKINGPGVDECMALNAAAKEDHAEIVKFIVENGGNLYKTKSLIYAAKNNNIELTRYLIEKKVEVDIIYGADEYYHNNRNNTVSRNYTALSRATMNANEDIIRLIIRSLKNQGKYLKKYPEHENLLSILFSHDYHISLSLIDNDKYVENRLRIAKFFIDEGLDCNEYGQGYAPPLIEAIKNNDLAFVNFLVENGADIYAQDYNGNGVLHRALKSDQGYHRKTEIIKYFINLAIDKGYDLKRMGLQNALGDAIGVNFKIAKLFVKTGAVVNMADRNGYLPVQIAATKNFEFLKYLVEELEVDINATTDKQPLSGLELLAKGSARSSYIQNIQYIVNHEDFDPNDRRSINALILAIDGNNIDMVRILIDAGVSPYVAINEKGTAFDVAKNNIKKGLPDITKILEDHTDTVITDYRDITNSGREPFIPHEERNQNKLSIAINVASDSLHSDGKGAFKMQQCGECLNSTADHRVRTDITVFYKNSSDKKHYLKIDQTRKPEIRKLDNFSQYCKKIIKSDYRSKNKHEDGYYYLFHHDSSSHPIDNGSYRTKLLSIHCQDQIEAIEVNNGAKILEISKDDDGFLHVRTDKICKISYILNVPARLQEITISPEIQIIIKQYNKNRIDGKGDGQFPVRESFANDDDWLDAVFENGGGSCEERVMAFKYQLEKNGINPRDYRIIEIDRNHVALEIKDRARNIWQYHDLGEENREKIHIKGSNDEYFKKEDRIPEATAAAAAIKKIYEEKPQPIKTIQDYLESSLKYETIDNLSIIIQNKLAIRNSLLITKYPNLAANKLIDLASEQGHAFFYIDSPEKIDIFKQVIAINNTNEAKIYGSGYLKSFLDYFTDPMASLIINWDAFNESQKVALNTILDEDATIQGVPLRNIKIIGLCAKEPKDRSFLSRHQKLFNLSIRAEHDLFYKATEIPILENDDESYQEIDFEGFANWRQKLFGPISIENNKTVWHPSKFTKLLQNGGKKFLIKNLSNKGKKEFAEEFARAKAQGYFDYYNNRFYISDDIKFAFAEKSFDFTKFSDSRDIQIRLDKTLEQTSADTVIINTQIFDKLLNDKIIKLGFYNETPGLIEKSEGKVLKLFITSELTKAQYYCLLNESWKHNVKLDLAFSPNATPDDSIMDELKQFLVKTDETISLPRVTGAKIVITNDTKKYLNENRKIYEDTIILDIEDYSYQDLVESLSFEIKDQKFQNFNKRVSDLIKALQSGQKIILKGEFPDDLLQMLQPILIQSYAKNLTLIIDNKELEIDKTTVNNFAWYDKKNLEVKQYELKKVRKLPPILLDEKDPNKKITDKSEELTKEFIDKRISAIESLLKSSPFIRLTGETGVGKSSLVREYGKEDSVNPYNELVSLKNWAMDKTPGKMKLLFIDEANIEDLNFTMFSPMLRAGNPTIFYQGEFFELTKDHKVVFAGNDISYGGGRVEQKLFADYQIPTLNLKDFPADYIYQKLLKEEVFNKVRFDLADIQPYEQIEIEKQFKKKCTGFILRYYQVNDRARQSGNKDQDETVRELQEYALDFLSQKINEKLLVEELGPVKSRDFVSVNATQKTEEALEHCLLIKSQQQRGILPTQTGLGGVFLEGGSGTGKSSLIKAKIEQFGQKYYKIDASTPFEKKVKTAITAFESGAIIWIDEINAFIDEKGKIENQNQDVSFEKVLNSLLNGYNPITGEKIKSPGLLFASANEASMDGRSIIGPALRHRMYCPKVTELKDYKIQDLAAIINHWAEVKQVEIDQEQLKILSKDCKDLLKIKKDLNLRDLEKAFDNYAKENCKTKKPDPITKAVDSDSFSVEKYNRITMF